MTFGTTGTTGISGISGISGWLDVYLVLVLKREACLVDVGEIVP